ncbi:MAG: hypothetical protein QM504_02695 [Pseudomonadota bacterium]
MVCRGLNALAEGLNLDKKIIVSMDLNRRLLGDIEIIPYREFLHLLWEDKLIVG